MSMNLGAMFMSASATYEMQRSHNFFVQFTGIGGNTGHDIMVSVQSFPLPTEANGVLAVNYGNTQVKFAGQTSWNSGSLVLRDYIDLDTELAIINWREQVYNPANDAIGWAVNYKKQGVITEVAPDGRYSRQWILDGCWPSDVDFGHLDHTSDALKMLTLTIQYDKAYRTGQANPNGITAPTSTSGTYQAGTTA